MVCSKGGLLGGGVLLLGPRVRASKLLLGGG